MDYLDKIGKSLIESHDFRLSDIKPHIWAQDHRVMTSEVSMFPGKFSYDKTPYLMEIVDHLSPDSPARIISVMKGAQIGFSTGVIENGIGFIISQSPAPILLMSGDKELSKESMEKRIDQMIDSCNLRKYIRPNSMRKRNMRTGDTSASKEFPGGFLIADGANNANKLRQRSFQIGFIDDFEAAPQSDKKAGSITNLIEQRFAAYYSKMKLFYISTPEVKQTSNIEPVFLLGDQRYFFLPCPKCGEFIKLEFKAENTGTKEKAGIVFKLDDLGKLIEDSVGYVCPKCSNFFSEKYKFDMLQNGIWKPTAEPSEFGYFSYHISALYAPPGMYNWTHYVRKFLDCYPQGLRNNPDTAKLRTWLNVTLGQTYEERGRAPKVMQLSKNTRSYDVETIPINVSEKDGNGQIILVTCACDLNGKVDDARLDYEILAWSETGSSYSVDYGSIGTFYPKIGTENRELYTYRNNELMNVWDLFLKNVLQKVYIADNGFQFRIDAVGIDTGNFTNYAYNFINDCQNLQYPAFVVGLKGEDDKIRKVNADTPTFRLSKERKNLYILEVNQIKDYLAERIELKWNENEGIDQPYGFINFPENKKYSMKKYFTQYESEHKVDKINTDGAIIGHRWVKKHTSVQNHFWDVAVYNMALKDIFSTLICKEAGLKNYDWSDFCQIMKNIL